MDLAIGATGCPEGIMGNPIKWGKFFPPGLSLSHQERDIRALSLSLSLSSIDRGSLSLFHRPARPMPPLPLHRATASRLPPRPPPLVPLAATAGSLSLSLSLSLSSIPAGSVDRPAKSYFRLRPIKIVSLSNLSHSSSLSPDLSHSSSLSPAFSTSLTPHSRRPRERERERVSVSSTYRHSLAWGVTIDYC